MKLSIIVPVYNTEQYLNKCLESILNQSFTDFEVIVVNDASPGNCAEIVSSYSDKRIKYVELDKNKGTYLAKIEGVNKALGEYITYVDGDDYFLHENVLLDLIPKIKDADILAYNFLVKYASKAEHLPAINNQSFDKVLTTTEDMYYELFQGGLTDSIALKITKRNLFLQCIALLPKNKRILFQEDYLITMFLLFYAKKIITTSYIGYAYFQPDESATKFNTMTLEKINNTLEDLSFVNRTVADFLVEKEFYTKFEKSIQEKNREFYNWILPNIEKNIDNLNKDLLDKAFPYAYFYFQTKDLLRENLNSNETCFVSIIIPVYNTEKYLNRCLDSIIKQDFLDYEIILVDDCSPGNCNEIVSEYQNSKIKYRKNPWNLGATWSRLHGLSVAKGKYVYFVDSDDWLSEDSLNRMFTHLSEGYDVLHFEGYWATDTSTWTIFEPYPQTFQGQQSVFENFFVHGGRRTLWCRVFKRSACLKAAQHVPTEWLSVTDDWLLNVLILWYCNSQKTVCEYYYYYYQDNPHAMTAQVEGKAEVKTISPENANKYLRQAQIVLQAVEKFLLEKGIMQKYSTSWLFYRHTDYIKEHVRPMAKGVQLFLLEEIKNNPDNVIRELKRMTHNKIDSVNIIDSLLLDIISKKTSLAKPTLTTKDLVKLLLKNIKKRNKVIGRIAEINTKFLWKLIKLIRK